MLSRILSFIIGYFVGALLQTGYWYGRMNHIDIRNYGSGNAGTTNVMRTLGKKAGLITYFVDALKAVLSAVIIHFLVFPLSSQPEMLLFLYSGFGVVIGHNFPFYLGFKGGKGIAASSGVVLSLFLFPKYCFVLSILGVSTFGITTAVSKYVSMGSLVFIGMFFIEFLIYGFAGWLPLEGAYLYEAYILVFLITALAFIRHRANIKRLINGNERKIGQKKTA